MMEILDTVGAVVCAAGGACAPRRPKLYALRRRRLPRGEVSSP
ncbi:hypothetical protein QJS66_09730 [Kocuria rhizophila]|nr:hypothetical protein QJS66_09730 [Kocuria rhizophila]